MIGNIVRLFPIFWNSWDLGASITDADISTGFHVCVSGWNSWGNVIKKTTWRKKRENNVQKVKTTDPPFSVPSPSPTFWLLWSLPAISGWRTTTETELQNSASQLQITCVSTKLHINCTLKLHNIAGTQPAGQFDLMVRVVSVAVAGVEVVFACN